MVRKKKITIPELVAKRLESSESALASLSKHLKSATGESYKTRANFLIAIFDRNSKNADMIAQIKDTQWRVVNYGILLLIAVTGAVQLVRNLASGNWYRIAVGTVGAICIVLIYLVARLMMNKIEADLAFYREHGKLNEEMLNITIGIQTLANQVVSLRRKELSKKHDLEFSADENRSVFSNWLYRIIAGSSVIALAVCELLVWAN